MIALGGTVTAKYTYTDSNQQMHTKSVDRTVAVQKVVKLNINILKNGANAVIATADVEADVKRMRELWPQVGIRVDATINNPVDPPAGVNLADGLNEQYRPVRVKRNGQDYYGYQWIGESLALVSSTNLQAHDPANNALKDTSFVHVYYVNHFTTAPTANAYSVPASVGVIWGDVAILANVKQRDPSDLAHEVFHVLENREIPIADFLARPILDRTHYPYKPVPVGTFERIHSINLMVSLPGTIIGNPPTVFDSVRLTDGQQTQVYARTLLVKDPS